MALAIATIAEQNPIDTQHGNQQENIDQQKTRISPGLNCRGSRPEKQNAPDHMSADYYCQ